VFDARQVRDAEHEHPGIVRETVDAKLEAGEEPRRADVKRAISADEAPSEHRPAPAKPDAEPERISPFERLKRESDAKTRRIAELEQKLAVADGGSLFDLKRDTADNIATTIIANVSEHKAREIVAAMNRKLRKSKPAG
jgi:hypothetical protein